MFSEENYALPTAIGVGKLAYCLLLCHNVPSIILRESMHKHTFGQTLKLHSAVVTVNIRSRSLNLIHSVLSPNKLHVSLAGLVQEKKTSSSEDRAQKRLNVHIF